MARNKKESPKRGSSEKRRGKGTRHRSETVSVRLDPKLRYLAEIAARRQRRTLSSFIEWAIQDSLQRVLLDDVKSVAEADLWDVDHPDRFIRLATRYEYLLTHDEQVLWKLIKENGYLWLGHYNQDGMWEWAVAERFIIHERLREAWQAFLDVAAGTSAISKLPTWAREGTPDTKLAAASPF